MLTQWTPTLTTPSFTPVMPAAQRYMQFRYPLPYGALLQDGGVQFVVYSRSATAMRVLLYKRVTDREPYRVVDFNRTTDRWGDIWSLFVPDLEAGALYHFQADGPYAPERGHRFRERGDVGHHAAPFSTVHSITGSHRQCRLKVGINVC